VNMQAIPQNIWNKTERCFQEMQKEAFQLRLKRFGNDLWCYSPAMIYYGIEQHEHQDRHKFISVSITGSACQLNCEHCKSKILETMHFARTPEKLLDLARIQKNKGCENILLSGGSNKDGSVPLSGFLEVIDKIKNDLEMHVFIHSGLITEEFAQEVSRINIDNLMFDVIGDDDTISKIYHLDKKVTDFENSLRLVKKYNIPHVPHIILGLNYGRFKGELKALEMIRDHPPQALVLVVLKPLENTPMQDVTPPPIHQISRFFITARFSLPDTPITLGCARPIGDYRIASDIQAIDSGLNGIAFLSQEGADHAESKNLNLKFVDTCCSTINAKMFS